MDSTLWGIPYSEWRFINSFAPWLSAITTIFAVIIAFIIFRKDKFMLLKFEMMVYTEKLDEGTEQQRFDHGICLYIINDGFRVVIVNQIDLIHEKCFLMTAKQKIHKVYGENLKVPIPILGQENVIVYFNKDEFIDRIKNKKDLFEINIRTSIGKSYRMKIPNDLTSRYLKSPQ